MLNKQNELMLFILGHFITETNKSFTNTPLELSVSKVDFIDAVMKLGVVSKKERAIYKNLEEIEKNKLALYRNKQLSLTKKGQKEYLKIRKGIDPYLKALDEIKSSKIFGSAVKAQTRLR
jgi:hypothetical protein